MIRPAKAIDLPALMAILSDGYARSRYADQCDIAVKHTEQVLLGMLMKHGAKAIDGTLCNVAVDAAGKIDGMHFAAKERVKQIGTKFYASDAFFYVRKGAFRAAHDLLMPFIEWASADPRVIEIILGTDDTIQDWRVAAKMYQRYGFEPCGSLLRRTTGKQVPHVQCA